jgi:hypothetical protein
MKSDYQFSNVVMDNVTYQNTTFRNCTPRTCTACGGCGRVPLNHFETSRDPLCLDGVMNHQTHKSCSNCLGTGQE